MRYHRLLLINPHDEEGDPPKYDPERQVLFWNYGDYVERVLECHELERGIGGVRARVPFIAVRDGVYLRDGDGETVRAIGMSLVYLNGFKLIRQADGMALEFDDYGRVWALTKEELK